MIIGLAAQLAVAGSSPVNASATAIPPMNADAQINTNANTLFDRDPAIKAWAVRLYDSNHDGWLTLYEAQPALAAFKTLADGDRDGRVTTYEYDRAKEFIAAR